MGGCARSKSNSRSARDSLLALFPFVRVRSAVLNAQAQPVYRTHTKVCRLRTACMTWKSPGHLVGREGPGSS